MARVGEAFAALTRARRAVSSSFVYFKTPSFNSTASTALTAVANSLYVVRGW